MAQVAAAAGVAKATLYNHFRTREAVLAALLVDEVQRADRRTRRGPAARPRAGRDRRTRSPRIRRCARWPASSRRTSRRSAASTCTAEGWRRGASGRAAALAAEGLGGTELVLRWLASYLLSPASPAAIAADLAMLLAGCRRRPVATATSRCDAPDAQTA